MDGLSPLLLLIFGAGSYVAFTVAGRAKRLERNLAELTLRFDAASARLEALEARAGRATRDVVEPAAAAETLPKDIAAPAQPPTSAPVATKAAQVQPPGLTAEDAKPAAPAATAAEAPGARARGLHIPNFAAARRAETPDDARLAAPESSSASLPLEPGPRAPEQPATPDAPPLVEKRSPPQRIELQWRDKSTQKAARSLPGAAPSQSADRDASEEAPGSPPPPPSPSQAARPRDMEQTFATRWAVWLGGAALAMGGLLIVRYGIEAGFFGPAFRIALGTLFTIVVAALSEYLRRREIRIDLPGGAKFQAPTILAGVAVLSAFGVIYAAHELYGFIGKQAAVGAFAAVGVAALFASLVHGPAFGLFGLLGSYATPLLVSAEEPSPGALGLFVAFVSATSWGLQLRRRSQLMQGGTILGHTLWTAALAYMEAPAWAALLSVAAAALATLALERGRRPDDEADVDARETWTALDLAAFIAPVVLMGAIWVAMDVDLAFRAALGVVFGLALVAAIRFRGLGDLALVVGAASIGVVLLAPTSEGALGLHPHLVIDFARLSLPVSVAPDFRLLAIVAAALMSLPPLAALLTGWRNGAGSVRARGALAFASALTPVGVLLAASLRLNGLERTTEFAGLAAGLTLAMAFASEILFRIEKRRAAGDDDPMLLIGSSAYAAGGAIALGLAIAFGLRETWLVVGFAVSSLGLALIARARAIPLLRSFAAAFATASLARAAWHPILSDLGAKPLANWLAVAYGAPAMAFLAAGLALTPRRDRARRVVETIAALFLIGFTLLEILHAFVGPDLWAARRMLPLYGGWPSAAHQEAMALTATYSLALALLAILFNRLAQRIDSSAYAGAESGAAGGLTLTAVVGLCVALNPVIAHQPVVGRPIFNEILFYYVGLGAFLGLLSLATGRAARMEPLTRALQGIAILLVGVGAALIVQHWFTGPDLLSPLADEARFMATTAHVLTLLALAAVVSVWRRAGDSPNLAYGFYLLVGIAAVVAVLRLGLQLNPFLDGSRVEGPIVFNRLLWGYGGLALGFLGLGWMTRRVDGPSDLVRLGLMAVGGGFVVLLIFLEMRHALHGPSLHSDYPVTLAEAGVYGLIAFAGAFLAARWAAGAQAQGQIAMRAGAALSVIGYWSLIALAISHFAPVVGWPIVNNTLVAFIAPALAALFMALWHERKLPALELTRVYGASAILGGLGYVLMQVRAIFPEVDWNAGWASSDHKLRLFAYSFALIGYGLALLIAGFRTRRRDLRLAAIAIIALATLKVFLLDLAGLEGLWRAASFIALGFSLMGIAYLYRLLMPPGAERESGPEADESLR